MKAWCMVRQFCLYVWLSGLSGTGVRKTWNRFGFSLSSKNFTSIQTIFWQNLCAICKSN